ncbi:MFS transporter [Blastomonas aquatica]|uniref:MFS transporter n=1 Tax=Blastomonas aquatica TaxID=1510276 RepID=UPI00227B0AF2|nr:MFS transporter [Blastomonas aquatica]
MYGFAHLGKSLFWYSSELLFAYFLTELAGLPVTAMGIVIATGFLVSAVIDIGIGVGLQRRLRTAASAGRMQLVGAVSCSLTLIAVFLGAWLPQEVRFGYALMVGVAFRFAFAAYDIPQNALMALGTPDAASRLRVASTRIWFSGAATLIVAAAVGPLVARGHADGIMLLLIMSAIFVVISLIGAFLLARMLQDTRPVIRPEPQSSPPGSQMPRKFWLLLGVMVATSLFTPAFGKLEPYFAAFTLRSAWWGGAVIIFMSLGIVAGQPLWLHLCRQMRSGWVMLIAALVQLGALTGFGLFGGIDSGVAAATAFGFGLGNGGVGMVQWAAFSETVSRAGAARAGVSYGLFAATGKVSLASGGLLIAMALARIDYRVSESEALVPLMAALPAAGAICCAIIGVALARQPRQA